MARFNYTEADNYGQQSNGSFFSLKNDREVARVRLMYNTIDDVEGYTCHKINVNGKDRYVQCIREYNEPIDNCPLCKAGIKLEAKVFMPLIQYADKNDTTGEVKIWDRGKNIFKKLATLSDRYSPLSHRMFEIERQGKPKSTDTTYEFFPLDVDNIDWTQTGHEKPQIIGGLVMNKNYQELDYYVTHQSFPNDGASSSSSATDNMPTGRRVPSGVERF